MVMNTNDEAQASASAVTLEFSAATTDPRLAHFYTHEYNFNHDRIPFTIVSGALHPG
jgi:hypothetical protein